MLTEVISVSKQFHLFVQDWILLILWVHFMDVNIYQCHVFYEVNFNYFNLNSFIRHFILHYHNN